MVSLVSRRMALPRSLVLGAASAAFLALAPVATFSQELAPEHLAMAREYVDLSDRGSVYERALVETGVQTLRTLVAQKPDIAEPTRTAISATIREYRERKGELFDQFARVYALRFNMEELEEILAFYKSPVGEKLTASGAEINTDMQRVMRVFQTNLEQEFFAKVRARLRAEGIEP